MTTLQKTLIATTLAVAVGTGIYEANRVSSLQRELHILAKSQSPLTDQNQQLQRERDEANRQIAALHAEGERLNRNTSELLKLRGEVARLRNESKKISTVGISNTNDPTSLAAQTWANRVKSLKQRFEQWPGKKTPELQLLTEQDWLNEAAKHQLDSEEDCREAISSLRYNAKVRFSGAVNKALEKFAEANNQRLPSDPSELAPHLEPSESLCLANWQVAQPGWGASSTAQWSKQRARKSLGAGGERIVYA